MNDKLRVVTALVLACAGGLPLSRIAYGQGIDFSQIDKFESLGSGTLHVGAPPKTIVDDGKRHAVVLTIWDADAETKVYWRSADGNADKTTIMPGRGIQTFQTVGELKLEAIGDANHRVEYGYVLLGLGDH